MLLCVRGGRGRFNFTRRRSPPGCELKIESVRPPKSGTTKELSDTMNRARIFQTKDVRTEIGKALNKRAYTDIALTYYHAKESLAYLSMGELLIQLKHWKMDGMEVKKSNVRKVTINQHIVYLFVVQQSDEAALARMPSICPFSAALGLMVTGVGYLCTTRQVLDLVVRYLGVEGATPNPLFA